MTQRRGLDRVIPWVALVVFTIAACAAQTTQAPPPLAASARPAPAQRPDAAIETSRAASRDASAPPPSNADGQAVFFRVCGPCHLGLWHVPTGGSLGPNERSEEVVRRQIRQGSTSARGTMPAIDERALPEPSMVALIEHLRSIRVVAPRPSN